VSELFVLKLPAARGSDVFTRYQAVSPNEAPAERCPSCGGAVALPAWQAPYRVELIASGALLADVAFGAHTDLLVTERFVDFWKAAGFTGLSGFDPVEVLDVSALTTFTGIERDYFHCTVGRVDSMLDDKESEAERTGGMPCTHCGFGGVLKHLRRVVLKDRPAPEPDLFVVKGLSTAVLASARFATALKASRVIGCLLVPADEVRAL
jgi:hypothetical protein